MLVPAPSSCAHMKTKASFKEIGYFVNTRKAMILSRFFSNCYFRGRFLPSFFVILREKVCSTTTILLLTSCHQKNASSYMQRPISAKNNARLLFAVATKLFFKKKSRKIWQIFFNSGSSLNQITVF